MIEGWVKASNYKMSDIFNIFNKTKIKGFVLTDVSRDGLMKGININLIVSNLSISEKPIIVGGGLKDYEDLIKLKNLNHKKLEGVIVGKSFYSGAIEIQKGIEILN